MKRGQLKSIIREFIEDIVTEENELKAKKQLFSDIKEKYPEQYKKVAQFVAKTDGDKDKKMLLGLVILLDDYAETHDDEEAAEFVQELFALYK